MPFKEHVENTLRINPEPTPLFKMILSAMAITTPLVIGHFNHELFVSMFGSLMGLVFYLNDHFDSFFIRARHLLVTFILLMISLAVGSASIGSNLTIVIILFILSFLLGKSKDYGIELERMMLFITLQFLTASAEIVIKLKLTSLLLYSSIALLNYLFWAYVIFRITKHQVATTASKRATVKKIISHNTGIKFPLVCAVFSTLGYILAQTFEFSHANWIVGTALIVILPDSYQSLYKGAQRVLGTILGVVIASVILTYAHNQALLIAFVFICSLLMPIGLSQNYWVGNIYIAAMILFFLEIAAPQSIATHHLAYWRAVDIVLGCSIGALAAIWMKPEIIKKAIKSLRY